MWGKGVEDTTTPWHSRYRGSASHAPLVFVDEDATPALHGLQGGVLRVRVSRIRGRCAKEGGCACEKRTWCWRSGILVVVVVKEHEGIALTYAPHELYA